MMWPFIVLAFSLALLSNEFWSWLPRLAGATANFAACLSGLDERYRAEWRAELAYFRGRGLLAFLWSLSLLGAGLRLRQSTLRQRTSSDQAGYGDILSIVRAYPPSTSSAERIAKQLAAGGAEFRCRCDVLRELGVNIPLAVTRTLRHG